MLVAHLSPGLLLRKMAVTPLGDAWIQIWLIPYSMNRTPACQRKMGLSRAVQENEAEENS